MNRYPFEEAAKSKHQASEKHQTSNPNEALLIADRRSIVAQISSNLLYRRASSLRDVDFTAYSRNSLALPIANRRYSTARASRNQSCFLFPVRFGVLVAACPRCAVCIWPGPASKPQSRLGTRPSFGRTGFMQTKPLPEDLVPKSFMDQFGFVIKCALGGWDRLRFHASLRPLFSPQWMRTYLCAAKVRLTDFAGHAQGLTHRLLQEAQNLATRSGRPYQFLRSSKTSKEKLIEDIAQRDRIRSGLIAVLGAVEPCLAMTVQGARDRRWLQPVREQRKCLHLYHYYEHPVVGRCHVRLQTWYPFSVDVCLNGRLWLAKQMDAAGLAYRRADNCFIELADPAGAQALADAQHQTNWLELLNGLLAPAHPLREQILKPFPNLFYYWTVTQSEYATDLLFTNERELARAYRAFVLHGLCTFQSPDVMRFLGHHVPVKTGRVDARFRGDVRSDVLTRHEGVCIKHVAGFNGQKAYDKFCNLLRVENTVNRPEAFTVFRAQSAPKAPAPLPPTPRWSSASPPQSLPADLRVRANTCVPPQKPQRSWQPLRRTVTDLPRRAQVSRAANKRYLEALASTQVDTPLGELAGPLCRPLTHDGRRYRALHPLGTDALLLRALSRGEWTIAGFRNRDLQLLLHTGQPRDKKAARRRSAAVGRKLRLLRAHGLIRKLPHTHRYLITESGRTILTALVAAQQANTQKLTLALAA